MKIRWRLKWRALKEISAAVIAHPLETAKLLLQLPALMWIHHIEDGGSDEPNPFAERFAAEERELRQIIKTNLFDALSPEFSGFARYFGKPKYSEAEVDEMFSYENIRLENASDQPYARNLAFHELNLLVFFSVISGISMLLDRLLHHKILEESEIVEIDTATATCSKMIKGSDENLYPLHETFLSEVRMAVDGRENLVRGMWRWIVDVLPYRPYLIEGWEARTESGKIALVRSKLFEDEFTGRWGLTDADRKKMNEANYEKLKMRLSISKLVTDMTAQ